MPVHQDLKTIKSEHPVHVAGATVFLQVSWVMECLVFPGGTICPGCEPSLRSTQVLFSSSAWGKVLEFVCLTSTPGDFLQWHLRNASVLLSPKLPSPARLLQWPFHSSFGAPIPCIMYQAPPYQYLM